MPPDQILAEELAAFHKRFPLVSELSDALDTLFSLARDQGLEVNRGEYILVEKAGGILRRFEVTLPVAGTYSQIRSFVLDVLGELPPPRSWILLWNEEDRRGTGNGGLRFVSFVEDLDDKRSPRTPPCHGDSPGITVWLAVQTDDRMTIALPARAFPPGSG